VFPLLHMIALWNHFIRYTQSCHYASPEFFSVILLNIAATLLEPQMLRGRPGGNRYESNWGWGNTDGL
jgi:hypothetical protein